MKLLVIFGILLLGAEIRGQRTIKAVTIENAPFTIKNASGDLEGYCVDLKDILAKKLNRNIQLSLVKDKRYGALEGGKWNGMIGALTRNEAEMALAPLTISTMREKVVAFSKPFMATGLSMQIKKPEKIDISLITFLQPFSAGVWVLTVVAFLGTSLVLFLITRVSPCEWTENETKNDFAKESFYFTFSSYMFQNPQIAPKSVSGRLAGGIWWMFTFIIVIVYVIRLSVVLSATSTETAFETVEDLAMQSKVSYGVQKRGSSEAYFKNSVIPLHRYMWETMNTKNTFVNSYTEGTDRVRNSGGKFVFIMEGAGNEYSNNQPPCDTKKTGDRINTVFYGVATPLQSDIKDDLNLAILELQESGELKKLENKWFASRAACPPEKDSNLTTDLSQLYCLFVALLIGLILAVLVAGLELFLGARKKSASNQETVGVAMKSHVRQSLTGKNKEIESLDEASKPLA